MSKDLTVQKKIGIRNMKTKKKALALMALSLCLPLMGLSSCGGGEASSSSAIASHDHVYETVSETKATCTEKGKKTERCTVCGKEATEETPALGHSLGEWVQKTPASCTKAEVLERKCTREGCDKSETKEGEAALGHLWGEWVTEGEKMSRKCTREGCEEKQEQLAPMVKVFAPEAGSSPYTENVENYLTAEDPNVADYPCKDEGNQGYKVRWMSSYEGVTSYRVECSKSEDFANPEITEAKASATEAYVFNLEKAATYYIRVVAATSDGEHISNVTTFETSDLGPRVMKIDGIHNVRDVGGYMTPDGRTLQGKIIRGGALSPSTYEAYKNINLSEEGKKYMSETLKIKTDFDLRAASENRSPDEPESAGLTVSPIPNANLEYHTANGYESIFTEKARLCDIFSSLADETKYPIYLHCTGGADRTGTYSFLINALLGVSEKELIHDYEYTSFSLYEERNSKTDEPYHFKLMLEKLKANYEGDTLQEKVENFLLSQGVTETQIYNLKAIMHGQPTKEEEPAPETNYTPAFDFASGSITLDASTTKAEGVVAGYDGEIYHAKLKETSKSGSGIYLFIGSYGFFLRGQGVRFAKIANGAYAEYGCSDSPYTDNRYVANPGQVSDTDLINGIVLGLSAKADGDKVTLSLYVNGELSVSYAYAKASDEIASSEAKFAVAINTANTSTCVISSPNE